MKWSFDRHASLARLSTVMTSSMFAEIVFLNVFPGRDAGFVFYDDAGDGYGYEAGESVRIAVGWNDRDRVLTIGDAVGSYPGSPDSRRFVIKTPEKTESVTYTGKALKVRL